VQLVFLKQAVGEIGLGKFRLGESATPEIQDMGRTALQYQRT
jgi:hypothetical protein